MKIFIFILFFAFVCLFFVFERNPLMVSSDEKPKKEEKIKEKNVLKKENLFQSNIFRKNVVEDETILEPEKPERKISKTEVKIFENRQEYEDHLSFFWRPKSGESQKVIELKKKLSKKVDLAGLETINELDLINHIVVSIGIEERFNLTEKQKSLIENIANFSPYSKPKIAGKVLEDIITGYGLTYEFKDDQINIITLEIKK